jgi:hypothetical protein
MSAIADRIGVLARLARELLCRGNGSAGSPVSINAAISCVTAIA